MTLTLFQKFTLGLAGLTALGVGISILTVPHVFYASYGITLERDVNLLSELRAPAAGLVALGGVMLIGLFRDSWHDVSISAALSVFIAFPAGRLIGVIVDGMPNNAILGALAIELSIAALCLAAFARRAPARTRAELPASH